jgi:GNAT superfamily N-acetyltransferase
MIIEPVPLAQYYQAALFLAGGAGQDAAQSAQARMLEHFAKTYVSRATLYQARAGAGLAPGQERVLAASMLVQSAGKTGFLVHSPAASPGVDFDALVAMLAHVSRLGLAGGLSMVQELLTPGPSQDITALQRAGYELLAELIYMRQNVSEAIAPSPLAGAGRRNYGQYTEQELGEVILRTYEDSRDCPRLRGVRRIEDIIAGHKASGMFFPDGWAIYYLGGKPAGCILINESTADQEAELVYFGVVPEFRGKGLSRLMLREGAAQVRSCGKRRLFLAVDAQNHFACRLYESEGFKATHRSLAYAIFHGV